MTELEYEEKRAIEDRIRSMINDELIEKAGHMMITGIGRNVNDEEYQRYQFTVACIRIELMRRLPNGKSY